jgi:hypothetical protein
MPTITIAPNAHPGRLPHGADDHVIGQRHLLA